MNLAVGGWLEIVWYARGWILCVSMVIVHASSRALKGLNFDKDVYDVKVLRASIPLHSVCLLPCHNIPFHSTCWHIRARAFTTDLLHPPSRLWKRVYALPACLVTIQLARPPSHPMMMVMMMMSSVGSSSVHRRRSQVLLT